MPYLSPEEMAKLLPKPNPNPPMNFVLGGTPGIKRDGSLFEGTNYTDGKWCRWHRGKPRKMGGYRAMSKEFSGPSRGLFVNTHDGLVDVFSGSASKLERAQFSMAGFGSAPVDITPSGFVTDANNVWQFDQLTDGSSFVSSLIAHAAPNLTNIDNTTQRTLYHGVISGTTTLTPFVDDQITPQPVKVSGGAFVCGPYVIGLDNYGNFYWTNPNSFVFPLANQARITQKKLVCGLQIRGGSSSPSGLVWSLSALIRASFVGGTAVWNFDKIADTTILSSSCPVQLDGDVYWIENQRFMMYNGVVNELDNDLSGQDFFDNLNYLQRQKIFGYTVPRFGEVVWCYPRGVGQVECNWMIVYNTRTKTWYDTPLPRGGRSAAYSPEVFSYPIMMTADATVYGNTYPLWMHEFGFDELIDNQINAIESYFITPEICELAGIAVPEGNFAPGSDANMEIMRIDADFKFAGTLQYTLLGRQYPLGADTTLSDTFNLTTAEPYNSISTFQARYTRIKVTSNVQGGFYEMGQVVLQVQKGDPRP